MAGDDQIVPVTTYHLEMLRRDQLGAKHVDDPNFQIRRIEIPSPEFNRFLYATVGWQWYWLDKLKWSYERWQDYVDRAEFETSVGYLSGAPAGYFELERQTGGSVEILYFGLLPAFTGRGLGGHLLTAAIERAWDLGASRVWVHTCTLDHPSALSNYLRRGFQLFKEVTTEKTIPLAPRRDWP